MVRPHRPGAAANRRRPAGTVPTRRRTRRALAAIATLAVLLPGASAPVPAVTAPPRPPAGWRLVWAEEFTGDLARWNMRRREARDVDRGCNTDRPVNAFVSDGRLVLRALRETVRCGEQTRHFTQGYLDTIGRASWTYGRFEVRARAPNLPGSSRGLWPAFWLRPDDGGHGEIDVVELPGGDAWYDRATVAIFRDYTPVKQDRRVRLPGGGHPGDGFHTYAVEWEPTALRWYVDGRLVWRRDPASTPWFDEVFHKPYHLRLNIQVGGWLGDPDGSTAFPADFVVDHVRIYQR